MGRNLRIGFLCAVFSLLWLSPSTGYAQPVKKNDPGRTGLLFDWHGHVETEYINAPYGVTPSTDGGFFTAISFQPRAKQDPSLTYGDLTFNGHCPSSATVSGHENVFFMKIGADGKALWTIRSLMGRSGIAHVAFSVTALEGGGAFVIAALQCEKDTKNGNTPKCILKDGKGTEHTFSWDMTAEGDAAFRPFILKISADGAIERSQEIIPYDKSFVPKWDKKKIQTRFQEVTTSAAGTIAPDGNILVPLSLRSRTQFLDQSGNWVTVHPQEVEKYGESLETFQLYNSTWKGVPVIVKFTPEGRYVTHYELSGKGTIWNRIADLTVHGENVYYTGAFGADPGDSVQKVLIPGLADSVEYPQGHGMVVVCLDANTMKAKWAKPFFPDPSAGDMNWPLVIITDDEGSNLFVAGRYGGDFFVNETETYSPTTKHTGYTLKLSAADGSYLDKMEYKMSITNVVGLYVHNNWLYETSYNGYVGPAQVRRINVDDFSIYSEQEVVDGNLFQGVGFGDKLLFAARSRGRSTFPIYSTNPPRMYKTVGNFNTFFTAFHLERVFLDMQPMGFGTVTLSWTDAEGDHVVKSKGTELVRTLFKEGQVVKVVVELNEEDYKLKDLKLDDTTRVSQVGKTWTYNVTLKKSYEKWVPEIVAPEVTLTIATDDNGTMNAYDYYNPTVEYKTGDKVQAGSLLLLKTKANREYEVDKFVATTADGEVEILKPFLYTVTKDVTIKPVFKQSPNQIFWTVPAAEHGSIEITGPYGKLNMGERVAEGTELKVRFKANRYRDPRYEIRSVVVPEDAVELKRHDQYSFVVTRTIPADSIKANYEAMISLKVDPGKNSKVQIVFTKADGVTYNEFANPSSPKTAWFLSGTEVTLVVSPKPGYDHKKMTLAVGGGTSEEWTPWKGRIYKKTFSASAVATSTDELGPYTLSWTINGRENAVDVSASGKIWPFADSKNGQSLTTDDTYTIRLKRKSGYRILSLQVPSDFTEVDPSDGVEKEYTFKATRTVSADEFVIETDTAQFGLQLDKTDIGRLIAKWQTSSGTEREESSSSWGNRFLELEENTEVTVSYELNKRGYFCKGIRKEADGVETMLTEPYKLSIQTVIRLTLLVEESQHTIAWTPLHPDKGSFTVKDSYGVLNLGDRPSPGDSITIDLELVPSMRLASERLPEGYKKVQVEDNKYRFKFEFTKTLAAEDIAFSLVDASSIGLYMAPTPVGELSATWDFGGEMQTLKSNPEDTVLNVATVYKDALVDLSYSLDVRGYLFEGIQAVKDGTDTVQLVEPYQLTLTGKHFVSLQVAESPHTIAWTPVAEDLGSLTVSDRFGELAQGDHLSPGDTVRLHLKLAHGVKVCRVVLPEGYTETAINDEEYLYAFEFRQSTLPGDIYFRLRSPYTLTLSASEYATIDATWTRVDGQDTTLSSAQAGDVAAKVYSGTPVVFSLRDMDPRYLRYSQVQLGDSLYAPNQLPRTVTMEGDFTASFLAEGVFYLRPRVEGQGTLSLSWMGDSGRMDYAVRDSAEYALRKDVAVTASAVAADGYEFVGLTIGEVSVSENLREFKMTGDIDVVASFRKVEKRDPDTPKPSTVESALLADTRLAANPVAELARVVHAERCVAYTVLTLQGAKIGGGLHDGAPELRIPTGNLAAGFYLVVLQAEDGTLKALRMVKE